MEKKFVREFESIVTANGAKQSTLTEFRHRFIVTEGMFGCDGTICDLPTIIELKKKFNMLIVVDETHSFASTGPFGITDYYKEKDPKLDGDELMEQLDVVVGSFENGGTAAIGGFAVGKRWLLRDMRL